MRYLFYFELKKQIRLTVFISFLMICISAAAIYSYEEGFVSLLNESRAQAPALFDAFGISGSLRLLDHIASLLFGFIFPVFGSLLAIFISSRLIPAQIESGEMAYYLSLPLRRYQLIIISAAVVLSCLIIALTVNFSGTLLAAFILKPGELNLSWFIKLNLGLLSLLIFSLGVALMIACVKNDKISSNQLNLIVFIVLFSLSLLGRVKSFPAFFQYLSAYSLWNPQGLSKGILTLNNLVMPLLGGMFLIIGIYHFSKRDLPL